MNPLDELARLRGQILAPAPTPVTVSMVEVETMIDMAIREARKDWMREMEVILRTHQAGRPVDRHPASGRDHQDSHSVLG